MLITNTSLPKLKQNLFNLFTNQETADMMFESWYYFEVKQSLYCISLFSFSCQNISGRRSDPSD